MNGVSRFSTRAPPVSGGSLVPLPSEHLILLLTPLPSRKGGANRNSVVVNFRRVATCWLPVTKVIGNIRTVFYIKDGVGARNANPTCTSLCS